MLRGEQALNITISLPKSTYRRIARWATLHQQDVDTTITEYLNNAIPAFETLTIPPAEPNPAVARERAAYLRLYPELQHTHAGQYIAIYNEQLIDADSDEAALFARIDDAYPDEFVWMTRVESVPEREISLRSPRFMPDSLVL
jgi:hypothetical protein